MHQPRRKLMFRDYAKRSPINVPSNQLPDQNLTLLQNLVHSIPNKGPNIAVVLIFGYFFLNCSFRFISKLTNTIR